MAWPINARYVSGVAKVTRITWALLNAIQDAIYPLYGGTKTVKAVQADATGNQAASVAAGDIAASGNVYAPKLYSTDKTKGIELRDGSTVRSYRLVDNVQTINATTTAVLTIPVPTGKAIAIAARGVGLKSDASAGAYHFVAAGRRNNAGTVQTIGSDQNMISAQQDAGWGGVSVVTSGTNALVRVTGAAATTINWTVDVDVTISS